MVTGYIKVNRFTKKHDEFLSTRGYKAEVKPIGPQGGKYIVVEAEGFVEKLNLNCDEDMRFQRLKDIITSKRLLTYSSIINFKGTEEKGLKVCALLEEIQEGLSALVVNPKHPVEKFEKRATTRGRQDQERVMAKVDTLAPIKTALSKMIVDGDVEGARKLIATTKELLGVDLSPQHSQQSPPSGDKPINRIAKL